jgi:hypothetical protein
LDCSRLLCFLRFKPQAIHKAFALTGRFVDCYYTQGVALGYELLPFQGVLLVSIALGYELLPFTFAFPFGQRFSIPFGQ